VYNSVKDKATLRMLVDKCFPLCQCPDAASPSESSSQCLQHESHKVAISIDEMERIMDIYGQCIATLVCYLEQRGDLEIEHITNDICKLKCSGGPSHLRALAKKVPSVAAAKKQLEKDGIYLHYTV
jgi:excinuclease UvrABC nuclease subunit